MNYRCSHCDYVSDRPGNCPTCDVPLTAEEGTEDGIIKDEETDMNDKEEME